MKKTSPRVRKDHNPRPVKNNPPDAPQAVTPKLEAFKLTRGSRLLRGAKKGDIVIVDNSAVPREGSIVRLAMGGKVQFRTWPVVVRGRGVAVQVVAQVQINILP